MAIVMTSQWYGISDLKLMNMKTRFIIYLLFAAVLSACSSDEEDLIGRPTSYTRIDIIADGVDLSEGSYPIEGVEGGFPILEGTIDSNTTDFTLKSTGSYSADALMVDVYINHEWCERDPAFYEQPIPAGATLYKGNWGHVVCLHSDIYSEGYYEYAVHIEENKTGAPRVFRFCLGDPASNPNRTDLYLTQEAKP